MKLNEHERPGPNLAGLMPSGQQAEMKLLLAGAWPPLRPLPVFKYESVECRASIEFDKARGEWVCRKIFLPSNNVQEVRGGLAEVARSLPEAPAEAFAEFPGRQQQVQGLDKEASRRFQTILEWKVNFESGAFYSALQNYLSDGQQQEIEEILRLTLTARQLQFSPKNVACVFEALSKAGGKLATLLEVAQRKKTQQAADPAAKVELTAPGADLPAPVPMSIPATIEHLSEELTGSAFPEQDQSSTPELTVNSASPVPEIKPARILEANSPSFAEERREKVHEHASVAGVRPQVRTRKVEPSANPIGNSASRRPVLEISGVHIAAFAVVFLFAMMSLPIGLTVGRGPLGQWLRDAQQSIFTLHVAQPALPDHPVETSSKGSAPPPTPSINPEQSSVTTRPGSVEPPAEKPGESSQDSGALIKAAPTVSNSIPAPESKPSVHSDAIPGRDGSAGIIARVAPLPAAPKPADSFKARGPVSGAWKNHASRKFAPSMGAPRRGAPPSGILVTTPAAGSKPFRVSFPEKPIAASSSFAMTSELSVLVPPEPGPGATHKSARLQAGELAYFVWPRYSRQGDHYGSAEAVRVRATVGQFGQVLDIKLLSGSSSLFPATTKAIRMWRYRPTFLNNRPIPVQQDITIEFRPPQYLSRVGTQHPSHN